MNQRHINFLLGEMNAKVCSLAEEAALKKEALTKEAHDKQLHQQHETRDEVALLMKQKRMDNARQERVDNEYINGRKREERNKNRQRAAVRMRTPEIQGRSFKGQRTR